MVSVSPRRYVVDANFVAGISDYLAGRPPPKIYSNFLYEDGRLFAAALRRRGLKPEAMSAAQRATWMVRLHADGTIISGQRRS